MDLTALNNITPYQVNNTLLNNTEEIGLNLINNANTTTGDYFGLGIMITIFIILLLFLMTEQDFFRLNFLQALTASSGFVLIIGAVGIVTGMFANLYHVFYFAIIFMIAILSTFYKNNI